MTVFQPLAGTQSRTLTVTVGRQLILKYLESMAGTTGLEPATSAVTAERKLVTYWNQGERMAPFSALRNPWKPLVCPYRARDLCPVDLCLNCELLSKSEITRTGNSLLEWALVAFATGVTSWQHQDAAR